MERDYKNESEPTCIFCEQRFILYDTRWAKVWEHLDNDDTNNTFENSAWAHKKCNEDKKFNYDFQLIATEKLKQNILYSGSLGVERRREKPNTDTHTNEQIDANQQILEISEKYLAERLLSQLGRPPNETELNWNDTRETIAFRCYKKHRHGSQSTVYRALKLLTCGEAPYRRDKIDGNLKIFKREGQ